MWTNFFISLSKLSCGLGRIDPEKMETTQIVMSVDAFDNFMREKIKTYAIFAKAAGIVRH
jgi:hypothetical protein